MIKIPPYLKKGDTIGITCPAGYMVKEKAQTCIDTLQSWGFQVMVGKTLGSNSANYFSGNDEQRLNELQAMLDDDSINAILCGRGGYGVGRIIDQLDFTRFKKKPKWIIGFSDITVLHCHLNSKIKVASMHAPMAAAFNEGKNEFIQSLHKTMTGKKGKYKCAPHLFNKTGKASGELVGGNLALLANMIGTASDLNTKNKILFIEDVGEYTYSVDRMMYQLKRSRKLEKLAGLIIGGFTDMKDTERPFGKNVYEAIKDILQEYNYPVCFNFPVSHDKENYALKVGVSYELTITNKLVTLSEV
ncbi:LD-carboxypeptidase [Ferruginibacter lapsinanis]|uniref:S66 peptidase family protein n=1 Tax=Ferruginibacter lapsinanis TaxID=563172 RepID=UPI001E63040F|nr:LD-carboxypeptidase [Ferruginibacter lapsinanis]UEG50286.1 LD-carboxypeptidase [Ferruginibacter lapsinanis]